MNYGPTFGAGHDIYMGNNSNQANNCYYYHYSYEKAIRNQICEFKFCVDEYEIIYISTLHTSAQNYCMTYPDFLPTMFLPNYQ
ncbi:hypothetical protein C2G38_2078100 [Gigaspora rosea]|uniref:TLDc domain-containing protein n=1 Tax=Gigaspora rosea TaxID=44941 RepID=A0A397VQS0_9GLOM|nr:hypothetical protein C2G38_2078100 [Gigaspora rosea]